MPNADIAGLCVPERLQRLAVSETGFVFDPQTGQSFTLNATGMMSLNLLKHGSSVDEAAQALAEEYGVGQEVASTSIEAFLLQLERYL